MKKLISFLDKFEDVVSIIFLVILSITVLIQVFCRYVLNSPLTGTEELARFAFIWMIFVGSAYVIKHGGHIGVEAIVMYLPDKVRKVIRVAINIMIIFTLIYILPSAIGFARLMDRIGSSALQIPMSYVYASVCVGIILMTIRLIQVSFFYIKDLTGNRTTDTDENATVEGGL